MNFLKNLFGGGAPRDPGYYVYVRPVACEEILKVRVDLYNDLSLEEDGQGYFVRKMARGHRCPFPVEMVLHFNGSRQLVDRQIEKGEFVTEEDYLAKYGEQSE